MKKGFTMIELIFVIVILGILASVAIPRLTATRDDAEIAKAATNLTTLLSDLGSYYTSQGKIADKISSMTNVQITTENALEGQLASAGKQCLKVKVTDYDDNTKKPVTLTVTDGGDANEAICKKILSLKSILDLKKAKYTYPKYNQDTGLYEDTETEGIAISGTGVKF